MTGHSVIEDFQHSMSCDRIPRIQQFIESKSLVISCNVSFYLISTPFVLWNLYYSIQSILCNQIATLWGASWMQRNQVWIMLNIKPWWVQLILGWVASVLTELGIQYWTAPICRSLNLGFSHWDNVKKLSRPSLNMYIISLYKKSLSLVYFGFLSSSLLYDASQYTMFASHSPTHRSTSHQSHLNLSLGSVVVHQGLSSRTGFRHLFPTSSSSNME